MFRVVLSLYLWYFRAALLRYCRSALQNQASGNNIRSLEFHVTLLTSSPLSNILSHLRSTHFTHLSRHKNRYFFQRIYSDVKRRTFPSRHFRGRLFPQISRVSRESSVMTWRAKKKAESCTREETRASRLSFADQSPYWTLLPLFQQIYV